MEVLTLVVVGSRREFHCTKINLPIDHLHFAVPADADIEQNNFFIPLVVAIFFHCEYLSLI